MFFYYLDFISPDIKLYYKGRTKHTSIFSIIISIISFIILLILSIIFSLDFFLHRNPTSFYYNRFVDDIGVFYLNHSSFFHFISFDNYSAYDRKAFSLVGVQNSIEATYVANNNESNFDHWIYDKCDKSDIDEYYQFLNDKIVYFQNGLCIKKFYNSTLRKVILFNESDFVYPTVEHGASNTNEIYYGVFIQRCQNNSEINSDCYDNRTIDNIIYSTISYSIFFIDHIIDIENYKHPFKYFFHQILNKYSTLSYTINVLNFQTLEIQTIAGIIFESQTKINTYKYDENEKIISEKSVENLNDNIFGAISLSMQNMQNIYSRKYKKLEDVAASIGGIIKIMNIFAFIINYIFYKFQIIKDFNQDFNNNYFFLKNKFDKSELLSILKMKTVNYFNKKKLSRIGKTKISKDFFKQLNLEPKSNENFSECKSISYNNYINNQEYKNIDNNSSKLSNNNYYKNNTHFDNLIQRVKLNNYDIFCYLIGFLHYKKTVKIKIMKNLIDHKKKIISEEEIFSLHYLLKSLQNNLMQHNKPNNNFI